MPGSTGLACDSMEHWCFGAAMVRGRLHIAIDLVANMSQRRSDALQWLEREQNAGSDHQGIPTVRQGIRKLDEDLASEGAKIVWLEDAISKHKPARQLQASASSSGPQLFGPGLQQRAPGGMSMTGSFAIEEL